MILIGLIFLGLGLSYLVGFVFIHYVIGYDIMAIRNIYHHLDDPAVVTGLKFMQLSNVLGTFILPVLFFAVLVSEDWKKYLYLDKAPGLFSSLSVIVMVVVSQPWINLMVSVNEAMVLPDFLSGIETWMQEKEAGAEHLMDSFMEMNNLGDLLFNILLIGLSAALGEELLFRGLLQPYIQRISGNRHLAVWVAAILFSGIHFQFYGFLPRMMLGVLFGYLLVWTNSIWLPVLAHFVNNAGAVLATYLFQGSGIGDRIEEVGSTGEDWLWLAITAPLLVYTILAVFRRRDL